MQYKGIELKKQGNKWYFTNDILAKDHPGTGRDVVRRQSWMSKNGVVKCHARQCLGKVAHGKAHSCYWMYGPRTPKREICVPYEKKYHEWFDHAEIFWYPARQEYILVAQPYNVTLADVQEMEEFAKSHNLILEVNMSDAWWYPGKTPLLIWRRGMESERP